MHTAYNIYFNLKTYKAADHLGDARLRCSNIYADLTETISRKVIFYRWSPNCAPRIPSSEGIRGYISAMTKLKFTHSLIKRIMFCKN